MIRRNCRIIYSCPLLLLMAHISNYINLENKIGFLLIIGKYYHNSCKMQDISTQVMYARIEYDFIKSECTPVDPFPGHFKHISHPTPK